ncbi:PREDICTED: keratin, type II cytoskeletal 1-like [Priapulus caudatus]|uniref:Keratin, type II cytoskeletal 1-like n=1 Tax=Priapulus caudatus TaxID=37621 RepID=A0ABM1EYN0_PRICU|nr:PREDICTED: keratin, type II cytoskeletal 1-like [Priapulus caudatus]
MKTAFVLLALLGAAVAIDFPGDVGIRQGGNFAYQYGSGDDGNVGYVVELPDGRRFVVGGDGSGSGQTRVIRVVDASGAGTGFTSGGSFTGGSLSGGSVSGGRFSNAGSVSAVGSGSSRRFVSGGSGRRFQVGGLVSGGSGRRFQGSVGGLVSGGSGRRFQGSVGGLVGGGGTRTVVTRFQQPSVVAVRATGVGNFGSGATEQPAFFTTTRYGPITSGGIRGSGDREATLSFSRTGSATGNLVSKDTADASESAAKNRGYVYRYREGHEYTQPRTLYNYDIEEPIWGFGDVDIQYNGE